MIDDQKLSTLKSGFGFDLVLVYQSYTEFRIPYQKIDGATIGRNHSNSYKLPDVDLSGINGMVQGVSRIHAKFNLRDGRVWIMDTASANGTFLNGQRLVPAVQRIVQDSDFIRLGHIVLIVRFD